MIDSGVKSKHNSNQLFTESDALKLIQTGTQNRKHTKRQSISIDAFKWIYMTTTLRHFEHFQSPCHWLKCMYCKYLSLPLCNNWNESHNLHFNLIMWMICNNIGILSISHLFTLIYFDCWLLISFLGFSLSFFLIFFYSDLFQ